MVLRKPYALLIRYFQRIHIGLIVVCMFLFYKTTSLQAFVKEYISTESYNAYLEPISNYTGFFSILAIFVVVIVVVTLMILLQYKRKPWKIYLFVLVEYIFLFGVFLYVASYFNDLDEYSTLTSILAGRDLLFLASLPQYVVFVILGIRVLGIDLQKFGFKEDEEYLSIKEEDREEFEVNIEFDKDKIKRKIRKFLRHVKYVYFEHRLVCNTILIILFGSTISYTYYYFGILHKTYRPGNSFISNNYQIKIGNSYLTERDTRGDLVEKDDAHAYVIVNIEVTNKGMKRVLNIDRFRLMNRNQESKNTLSYSSYFKDLGTVFDKREMATGETKRFTLQFKVKKDLNPKRYVLYYQDLSDALLIKKIKLNVNDLRTIKTVAEKKVGEVLTLTDQEEMTITESKITDTSTYTRYQCKDDTCGIYSEEITNQTGKILEIAFVSDSFEGKSFVDFLEEYAKIKYENSKGKIVSSNAKSVISKDYNGNVVYLKVPADIKVDGKLSLVITMRNKRYLYTLQ